MTRKCEPEVVEWTIGRKSIKRKILDMAMENRIGMLEQEISKLKKENAELKIQSAKQQKLLNKRNLSVLKS